MKPSPEALRSGQLCTEKCMVEFYYDHLNGSVDR